MVAYADVPAVNALYMEQEVVTSAITMIDSGGKVTSFTISPVPPDPAGMPAMMPTMPAMIAVPDAQPELIDQARAALVIRQNAIITELAALGITDSPPARSARE